MNTLQKINSFVVEHLDSKKIGEAVESVKRKIPSLKDLTLKTATAAVIATAVFSPGNLQANTADKIVADNFSNRVSVSILDNSKYSSLDHRESVGLGKHLERLNSKISDDFSVMTKSSSMIKIVSENPLQSAALKKKFIENYGAEAFREYSSYEVSTLKDKHDSSQSNLQDGIREYYNQIKKIAAPSPSETNEFILEMSSSGLYAKTLYEIKNGTSYSNAVNSINACTKINSLVLNSVENSIEAEKTTNSSYKIKGFSIDPEVDAMSEQETISALDKLANQDQIIDYK